MKKDKLLKRLSDFRKRYQDLVWHARTPKTDPKHSGLKSIERI